MKRWIVFNGPDGFIAAFKTKKEAKECFISQTHADKKKVKPEKGHMYGCGNWNIAYLEL